METGWYEVTKDPKWKYKTLRDMSFTLPRRSGDYLLLNPKNSRVLASVSYFNTLTVHAGFSWDGATCAPDFPRCMRATLIHDLMCQCVGDPVWVFNRQDGDNMFLDVARQDGFNLAWVYYAAVRAEGVIMPAIRNRKPSIVVIPCHEIGG